MSDTTPPNDQLSGVTPHITIRGGSKDESMAEKAIAFYQQAFGAEPLYRDHEQGGKRLMYAHLKILGGGLMLNDEFPEFMGGETMAAPSGATLHLQVPDADAAWQRALDAGAEVRFPIDNQFWGARYGQLTDPFGFIWSIGGPVKE
ncbi:MAG: VOC family protein [Pseudomonadota bacterium]